MDTGSITGPRQRMLDAMATLQQTGIHCGECAGVCCTHLANSMKITLQEALEIKTFLVSMERWTPDLFEALRETVRRYRLDQELGDGRRSFRKTYTCPFFAGSRLGCTIAPAAKPLGCLAFNPRSPGLTQGGDCATIPGCLPTPLFPEEDRWPIPVALLRLRDSDLPV